MSTKEEQTLNVINKLAEHFTDAVNEILEINNITTTTTKKRDREEEEDDDDFICEGRIWEDPPAPCLKKEPNCHVKDQVTILVPNKDGKNKRQIHTVCLGCKKTREAYNSKRRKQQKKEQEK